MTVVRESTTLDGLRTLARERARFRPEPSRNLDRASDANNHLRALLDTDAEPSQVATALGILLQEYFTIAALLRLDPAGCMTLASMKEATQPDLAPVQI